jgi:hypothetical protein
MLEALALRVFELSVFSVREQGVRTFRSYHVEQFAPVAAGG